MEINERIKRINGMIDKVQDPATKEILLELLEGLDELTNQVVDLDYKIAEIDEDMAEFEEMDFFGANGGLYETTCPHCEQRVTLDRGMMDVETVLCPNCQKEFELEFTDELDGGCSGGCGGGCSGCGID